MEIYTIGFTKKSAQQFFDLIQRNTIDLLIDIRLNNSSQLAGFSKGSDLEYFLSAICGCEYRHDLLFAPTQELMDDYKTKKISTEQFDEKYTDLIKGRNALAYFKEQYAKANRICLLCSEDTPKQCHRRTLSDLLLKDIAGSTVTHLI